MEIDKWAWTWMWIQHTHKWCNDTYTNTPQKGDALEKLLVLHLNWLSVGKRTDSQPDPVVKYFLDIVSETNVLACLGAKC